MEPGYSVAFSSEDVLQCTQKYVVLLRTYSWPKENHEFMQFMLDMIERECKELRQKVADPHTPKATQFKPLADALDKVQTTLEHIYQTQQGKRAYCLDFQDYVLKEHDLYAQEESQYLSRFQGFLHNHYLLKRNIPVVEPPTLKSWLGEYESRPNTKRRALAIREIALALSNNPDTVKLFTQGYTEENKNLLKGALIRGESLPEGKVFIVHDDLIMLRNRVYPQDLELLYKELCKLSEIRSGTAEESLKKAEKTLKRVYQTWEWMSNRARALEGGSIGSALDGKNLLFAMLEYMSYIFDKYIYATSEIHKDLIFSQTICQAHQHMSQYRGSVPASGGAVADEVPNVSPSPVFEPRAKDKKRNN